MKPDGGKNEFNFGLERGLGRERDKQIAELKGERIIDDEVYVCEMFRGKDGLCVCNPIPRSTSWNDAKELLIELQIGALKDVRFGTVINIIINEWWVILSVQWSSIKVFAKIKDNRVDEAMADAVSQAWYIWTLKKLGLTEDDLKSPERVSQA